MIIQQQGNHILREMSQVKKVIDISSVPFYVYYTLKEHSGYHTACFNTAKHRKVVESTECISMFRGIMNSKVTGSW